MRILVPQAGLGKQTTDVQEFADDRAICVTGFAVLIIDDFARDKRHMRIEGTVFTNGLRDFETVFDGKIKVVRAMTRTDMNQACALFHRDEVAGENRDNELVAFSP